MANSSRVSYAPDPSVLERLRAADNNLLGPLYDSAYPMVAAHIRKNQGSAADAQDVFQEALIALVQNAKRADFSLTAAPGTYVFAISRNLWLKRLRERKRLVALEDNAAHSALEDPAFELVHPPSVEERTAGILQRISDHCLGILNSLFLLQEPMTNLMARMGWKNKHTADNQKYKCIQQARKVALQ